MAWVVAVGGYGAIDYWLVGVDAPAPFSVSDIPAARKRGVLHIPRASSFSFPRWESRKICVNLGLPGCLSYPVGMCWIPPPIVGL